MELYVAPLESITGYVFRNIHHKHFPGTDKYYIPFIEPKPNAKKIWTGRVWNDIDPKHNKEITVIPQILTNKWEDFLWTTERLEDLGYTEVNLNLGCPSKTVVSKNRGAGFLFYPEELDTFLYYIFEQCNMKISIKTRVGRDDLEEFEKLLSIYEKYPLSELIIHARTQKDYYNKPLREEAFTYAYGRSKHVLGYNGEIVTKKDYNFIEKKYPNLKSCMMGRGILRNPQLIENIQKGSDPDLSRIKAFHDELLEGYREVYSGDTNVLFRMKELWCYMGKLFEDPNGITKKILKVKKLNEFIVLKERVFEECGVTKTEQLRSEGIWKL